MYHLAREHGEAGIFFADVNVQGSLAETLAGLLRSPEAAYDRRRIRERFARQTVCRAFTEQVQALPARSLPAPLSDRAHLT